MNNENWLAEFLDESIPLWTNDPVLFMREVLLFEPDNWQKDVAYDLRDYPRCRSSIAFMVLVVFPICENCCNSAY